MQQATTASAATTGPGSGTAGRYSHEATPLNTAMGSIMGIYPSREGGVVLLVGSPGTGKSLLGRATAAAQPQRARFLSVGDVLRAEGLVAPHLASPTAESAEVLRSRAREIINEAFRELSNHIAVAGTYVLPIPQPCRCCLRVRASALVYVCTCVCVCVCDRV